MSVARTRQIIFLLIALAVAIPLLLNIDLAHSASPETRQAFANIDTLPAGSIVMISFDFEASAIPEVGPLAEAVLTHCFSKGLYVVGLSLFAEGTALGAQMLESLSREHGREYGADYVYLGFRPQYQAAILGMGESIAGVFPRDYYDQPLEEQQIFEELVNYEQIALLISITDGSMPTYWAEYAVARYGANLQVALTATMATAFYPYLDSGQIKGLLAGLKGAAEYEQLLQIEGGGSRGLLALSVSQVAVMLVILAGIFGDYRRRRSQ